MRFALPFPDADAGDWRTRASDAIPGGSSTGSKRPEVLYGARALDRTLPTHFERAEGCTLYAPDGRRFIDCSMALGAVAIGYADVAITRAVTDAAAAGCVSGLPHRLEVEVAEQLIELIPSAEQVRFLRTGAEATAAAVRIARTATGRSHVIGSGYFGWLDWCSDAAGVPQGVRADFTPVPFDDLTALRDAVAAHAADLAAIIIEPLVHEVASVEWLRAVRDACTAHGAVMIMDEIKTAFRIRTGGVQELTGVMPDLTTLGKAMANGFPLAAVVGRAEIMRHATGTWISSTAAAESTGLAAARAVCAWHERVDVPARLASAGQRLLEVVQASLARAEWTGVSASGPAQMWRLIAGVPVQLDAFVAAGAVEGVLFKRGAYQFASLAHDDATIDAVARAMPAITQALVPGPRRTSP